MENLKINKDINPLYMDLPETDKLNPQPDLCGNPFVRRNDEQKIGSGRRIKLPKNIWVIAAVSLILIGCKAPMATKI